MIFNIVFGTWCFLTLAFIILVFGSNGQDHAADFFLVVCMIGLTIMAVYSKDRGNN